LSVIDAIMKRPEPVELQPELRAVALELTNHCNLSCPVCHSQNPKLYPPRPKGYMKWEMFERLVDELAYIVEFQKQKIHLALSFGGESLLHPGFTDFLKHAAKSGHFHLRLYTNLVSMPEPATRWLAITKTAVTVSIHFSKHLDRVLENLRLLSHFLEIEEAAFVDSDFSKEDAAHLGARISRYVQKVGFYPYLSEDLNYSPPKPKAIAPCDFPFYYMAVLWNGTVWPCCRLLSSQFKGLGNVGEGGIWNIWTGEKYTKLRAGKLLDAPCLNCHAY